MVLAAALGAAAIFYGRSVYEAPGPLGADAVLTISRGMRAPDIAAALEKKGIISDDRVFLAAAYLTQNFKRMRAGEYQFTRQASMAEVMDVIVSGKEYLYKVTLPEGWTTAQLVNRLNSRAELAGTISEDLPEGVLLPATYGYRRGAERQAVIDAMREAQDKLLADLWSKRASDLPIETKEEALILASIVEKETAEPEERPRVAAVFLNRLRKRMRLQSDPTIVYGITLGKRKLDRPILQEDIDAKNPYNTYQVSGLPPTPIANPGRESIMAVLNPIDTGELYFVADGSGGHVFAKSLEEHNRNVQKWRKIERAESVETQPAEAANMADDPDDTAAVSSQEVPQAPLASVESTEVISSQDSALVPEPPAGTLAPTETTPDLANPDLLKPGSVVEVAGKLIPIPAPRPKLQ